MLGRKSLTMVNEAIALLKTTLVNHRVSTETLPLEESCGRVLAETIVTNEDLPAHPRSTMDGYAIIAADTFGASSSMPCYLEITGEVLMGTKPTEILARGKCLRISTGGLLPSGADAIIMLEHTIPVDETLIEVVKSVGAGTHIIHQGEDIQKDQVALRKGHILRPQDIGLLAGIGITDTMVFCKPKIGILATGDEIVPYPQTPPPGKIRNINNIALFSQAQNSGAIASDYGIVSDIESHFRREVKRAIDENDLVIFSGGSSVGMRDLGERVIESLGDPGILIHGVALKPGKPIIIGLNGKTPLFGLPGHPVSAMVCFDFFVKPVIDILSGIDLSTPEPLPTLTAHLDRNINSAPGRLDLIRVQLIQKEEVWHAIPILGKSGSISTLSRAQGYFLIDEKSQGVTENTEVEVYVYQ